MKVVSFCTIFLRLKGVHEGRSGEPPSGQQRVASSEDHHLPLGKRSPRRQDGCQPLAKEPVTEDLPNLGGPFFVIVHSVNYQYNNPNIHNGMRFR